MTLTNGYKLVYETITVGDAEVTKTFKASTERYPTDNDITILEYTRDKNSTVMIYEYEGNFYAAENGIPTYNAEGAPTDTCISDNENFRLVFGIEAPVEADDEEELVEEPDVTEAEGDETEAEGDEPEAE